MLINLKLMKNYVINDEKNPKQLTTTKPPITHKTHNVGTIFSLVILSLITLDQLESEKIGTGRG